MEALRKDSATYYEKHLSELKRLAVPDATVQALENAFSSNMGINWMRYNILKLGYKIGAYDYFPLVTSLRGDTSNLEKSFNWFFNRVYYYYYSI